MDYEDPSDEDSPFEDSDDEETDLEDSEKDELRRLGRVYSRCKVSLFLPET